MVTCRIKACLEKKAKLEAEVMDGMDEGGASSETSAGGGPDDRTRAKESPKFTKGTTRPTKKGRVETPVEDDAAMDDAAGDKEAADEEAADEEAAVPVGFANGGGGRYALQRKKTAVNFEGELAQKDRLLAKLMTKHKRVSQQVVTMALEMKEMRSVLQRWRLFHQGIKTQMDSLDKKYLSKVVMSAGAAGAQDDKDEDAEEEEEEEDEDEEEEEEEEERDGDETEDE